MSPGRGRRRFFRLPTTPRRRDAEVDDELRFHLQERTEELMTQGMSPDDAAREARRRFGDYDEYRRQARAIDERTARRRSLGEWWGDVRREAGHGARTLRRSPAFTLIAFVTLALGIGATTAIFTMLDAVVLRPLPYFEPERLVYLSSPTPGVKAGSEWGIARHEVFYFKDNSRAFESIGVASVGQAAVSGDGGHETERVRAASVSASLFDVLKLRPAYGRLLVLDDNRRANKADVVVLGWNYWQRRFGGDPAIVGRTIEVNGYPTPVVGIMERGGDLPDLETDLWGPAYMAPELQAWNNHTWQGYGRLAPGWTAARAEQALAPLTARLPEVYPNAYSTGFMRGTRFSTRVRPLRDAVVGETMTRALWLVFAAVGFVLLIAAANVANIFLVRIDARRREAAVRTALGAGRANLAWHYLSESLILAGAAAAGALFLAWAGLRALLALAPTDLPRLSAVHLGWASVAFAIGLALAAGIVFGLLPLLQRGVDVAALREGGRGLTSTRARQLARSTLVVAQVAMALVLLAGAGLMVRSFQRLRRVEPGFDPRNVLTMAIALPYARYDGYAKVNAFYERLATEVRALPGVTAVGFGETIPLDGGDGCSGVSVEAPTGPDHGACVPTQQVSPGFFEALGIRVTGRAPDWTENDRGTGEMVVSRAIADRFWPGENPIGKGIRGNGNKPPFYRVVGVADDVRGQGLDRPVSQNVYFPMLAMQGAELWSPPVGMNLVVRTATSDPASLTPAIRRIVARLDPQVPIANVRSMETVVAKSMAKRSFTMFLLAVAAAMALVLSAVGIYGVISYIVAQRRAEIGIRMALGARVAQVAGLVVAQSLRLAILGVVLGLVGAAAATRAMQSLLFEVSPTDPTVLVGVAAVLLLLAAVASLAPARRAAGVDPAEVLRSD